MKKYCVYPGIGKTKPFGPDTYIGPKELAKLYSVPFEYCHNMEDPFIKKVASRGAKFDKLLHLTPSQTGVYKLPTFGENRIIVQRGLHEAVKT